MFAKLTTSLFLALALMSPSLQADHHENPQAKVSQLMERIESNALDMRQQAARLKTYNRAPQMHSWEIHADELRRISGELDNVADLMKKLTPMKTEMTFRQTAAFNHMISLSSALSDVTGKAIKTVNTDRAKLSVGHPDYETKVNAIYEHADMIAAHADSVESSADFFEDLREASKD